MADQAEDRAAGMAEVQTELQTAETVLSYLAAVYGERVDAEIPLHLIQNCREKVAQMSSVSTAGAYSSPKVITELLENLSGAMDYALDHPVDLYKSLELDRCFKLGSSGETSEDEGKDVNIAYLGREDLLSSFAETKSSEIIDLLLERCSMVRSLLDQLKTEWRATKEKEPVLQLLSSSKLTSLSEELYTASEGIKEIIQRLLLSSVSLLEEGKDVLAVAGDAHGLGWDGAMASASTSEESHSPPNQNKLQNKQSMSEEDRKLEREEPSSVRVSEDANKLEEQSPADVLSSLVSMSSAELCQHTPSRMAEEAHAQVSLVTSDIETVEHEEVTAEAGGAAKGAGDEDGLRGAEVRHADDAVSPSISPGEHLQEDDIGGIANVLGTSSAIVDAVTLGDEAQKDQTQHSKEDNLLPSQNSLAVFSMPDGREPEERQAEQIEGKRDVLAASFLPASRSPMAVEQSVLLLEKQISEEVAAETVEHIFSEAGASQSGVCEKMKEATEQSHQGEHDQGFPPIQVQGIAPNNRCESSVSGDTDEPTPSPDEQLDVQEDKSRTGEGNPNAAGMEEGQRVLVSAKGEKASSAAESERIDVEVESPASNTIEASVRPTVNAKAVEDSRSQTTHDPVLSTSSSLETKKVICLPENLSESTVEMPGTHSGYAAALTDHSVSLVLTSREVNIALSSQKEEMSTLAEDTDKPALERKEQTLPMTNCESGKEQRGGEADEKGSVRHSPTLTSETREESGSTSTKDHSTTPIEIQTKVGKEPTTALVGITESLATRAETVRASSSLPSSFVSSQSDGADKPSPALTPCLQDKDCMPSLGVPTAYTSSSPRNLPGPHPKAARTQPAVPAGAEAVSTEVFSLVEELKRKEEEDQKRKKGQEEEALRRKKQKEEEEKENQRRQEEAKKQAEEEAAAAAERERLALEEKKAKEEEVLRQLEEEKRERLREEEEHLRNLQQQLDAQIAAESLIGEGLKDKVAREQTPLSQRHRRTTLIRSKKSVAVQDLTVVGWRRLTVQQELEVFGSVWEAARKGSSVGAFRVLLSQEIRGCTIQEGREFHIDERDRVTGERLLQLASWCGHTELVRFLVEEAGASVNLVDGTVNRLTPLHDAARGGWADIVEILLQAGAQVDALDSGGDTALHWAARRGNLAVVKRMLQCSATLFTDHEGRKAVWRMLGTRNGKGKLPFELSTKESIRETILEYVVTLSKKEQDEAQLYSPATVKKNLYAISFKDYGKINRLVSHTMPTYPTSPSYLEAAEEILHFDSPYSTAYSMISHTFKRSRTKDKRSDLFKGGRRRSGITRKLSRLPQSFRSVNMNQLADLEQRQAIQ